MITHTSFVDRTFTNTNSNLTWDYWVAHVEMAYIDRLQVIPMRNKIRILMYEYGHFLLNYEKLTSANDTN